MTTFGADEAGRGPALGSMFAGAVAVADLDDLPDGVADSKQLTRARRAELYEQLCEDDRIRTAVAEIPTGRIDDPETDMNTLTVEAQAAAIGQVVSAGDEGVVDACDTSESRFARRVADAVPATIEITAEHGADDEYRIVAAASIVAKVTRDRHVDALAERYGAVGSGYPSDPATREFLEDYVAEHGELPECARESWGTCTDVLAAAEQTGLDGF
ncbi:ribonuclease HII [Natranaeroarchaeum sulfidigenes]|uniref:Ribonuclease HII n=1 Tax=Natranaeroarchaeum sulfidigenes TaxID=2784880 RepID=A0A897MHP0_9EURY|nr:ribonuclease HII [Natranaeroarchaeum sulfidigenes]QSG01660.1 Ribonuclease HII [Natranaeroarchaeum sulfidigenes]